MQNLRLFLLSFTFLFAFSCGQGGKNVEIPGVNGPAVQLVGDTVEISSTIENLEVSNDFSIPLPNLDDSVVNVTYEVGVGTKVTFLIKVADLLNADPVDFPPSRLPGGRNLPGFNDGTHPGAAFKLGYLGDSIFYLGESLFGFFIPVNIDYADDAILSYRFYIADKHAGMISIVGRDENLENSGILLMLKLDTRVKRYLKKRISRI